MEDTAERLMEALIAAGVGERPIVFVAHSMGGLLVKVCMRHKGTQRTAWAQRTGA